MKTKSIKYILAAGLLCCGLATTMTSCSDVLDEQPRSQFDPTFFNTKAGIEGGLTSLYAHLRYFYGNGYYLNSVETGTDEYTYAQSADGNFKDADLSGVGQMVATNSIAGSIWGTLFPNINTASGIIENGAEAGIDADESHALYITGGNLFAIGGRMDVKLGSTSQGIINASGSVAANSTVTVGNGSTTLATFTMPPYSNTNGTILITATGVSSGSSYTLNIGGSSQTVTATNSISGTMGGMPGGNPGGGPGRW